MFVGGEFVDSSTGETQAITSPATGETIAEVPKASAEDVNRAVAAARTAFDETWFDSTPGERQRALLKLADLVEEHGEELGRLEAENVGKVLSLVMSEEIPVIADNFRFFAGGARFLEGRAAGEYMKGFTSIIRREPIGVAGLIAPWNYPLFMAAWKLGPALAAGNCVVIKPSEWTPLTLLRLAELAAEAEVFPPGVFNVVTGDGEPAGDALVRNPDVGIVSLTGDVDTGKLISRNAADTLKRVHLELGGKAPVVVFDDADIASAVEWIKIAGYFNSGQDCTAAARVLAGSKVYDNLLGDLVPAVESLAVGDIFDENTEMGSLVSGEQLERVTGFVDRARDAGAKVLTGGSPIDGKGSWYRPTVVADVGQDAEIVQREVFGPVLTFQTFADEEEGVALANSTRYGLSGIVYTGSEKRAARVGRAVRAGTVWVNTFLVRDLTAPFGGVGISGIGREGGDYALDFYSDLKTLQVLDGTTA
jgi:1-pyrroline dehydrogenase